MRMRVMISSQFYGRSDLLVVLMLRHRGDDKDSHQFNSVDCIVVRPPTLESRIKRVRQNLPRQQSFYDKCPPSVHFHTCIAGDFVERDLSL